MQQVDEEVILFEDGTERELLRFIPSSPDSVAKAQKIIHDSELGPEDKSFAHMWSGYFYHAATAEAETILVLSSQEPDLT